jgi:hypothetical protein
MRPHFRRLRLLFRLSQWTTIVFLLCGFGLCFVSFPKLHPHVPAALMQCLERFYQTGELRTPLATASPPPTPATAGP